MSRRPAAQPRPGFIKVCLCPGIVFMQAGEPKHRDLTPQCKKCLGFAALERCPDCEDRGALSAVGQKMFKKGRLATYCETCGNRGYLRTDRKYDAYAERPKEKKKPKKRKR